MRSAAQPDAAVRLHREADVREHRVVVVVGELLVGVAREVVALGCAQLALAALQRLPEAGQVVPVRLGIELPELEILTKPLERALGAPAVLGPGTTTGHQHAGVAGRVEVELAAAVVLVHHGQRLGVDERQVVALVEVVLDALPVPVALDRHPVRTPHVLHAVRVEMVGHGMQPGPQVVARGVHVEPDESGPRVARDLDQVALAARVALGEVVRVGHPGELAVRRELPAVVGALELAGGERAGLRAHEAVAAVLAHVVERAHPAVVAADAEDRVPADLVGDVVAGVRDLVDASGDLPDARPQPLRLGLRERRRPVALATDRQPGQLGLGCLRPGDPPRRVDLDRIGHRQPPSYRLPA